MKLLHYYNFRAVSLQPACVARIFVGSGRPPSRGGRYQGFNTEIDPATHRARIEEIVREEFPFGSTHIKARGTFRGSGGRVISESSIIVEVWARTSDQEECAAHLRKAEAVAARLRAIFGQELVAVVATNLQGRALVDFVARAPRWSRFGAA